MASNPNIAKKQLGHRLRFYRDRAGMTPSNVDGTGIGSKILSRSKLYQLERGAANGIKWQDISALGERYGVNKEERLNLIALAESSTKPGLYESFDGLGNFSVLLDMESIATQYRCYEPEYVHGLLQTEKYLATIREVPVGGEPDRGLRMKRQENFFELVRTESKFLSNEAVLKRRVGGARVMREQRARLLELSAMPNISIQVLPFSVGAHSSMRGAYTLLDFEVGVFPKTAYVESFGGALYVEDAEVVSMYETVFAASWKLSVPIKDFLT